MRPTPFLAAILLAATPAAVPRVAAGPRAHRRRGRGPAPDQPLRLRHELRRRGARRRARPAGAPLGRQRHHPLQLPLRHHQPGAATGSSRTSPRRTPIPARCPTARRPTGSSSRTGHRQRHDPDRAADRLDAEGPRRVLRLLASPSTARSSAPTSGGRTAATASARTAPRSPATTRGTPASPVGPRVRTRLDRPPHRQVRHGGRGRRRASTTSTTSRTSGTAPTATCTRSAPSYDELRDRAYEIGAAVKAADPSAATLGPVGWGWTQLGLLRARPGDLRPHRLLGRPAGPRGPRRAAVHHLVSAADAGVRAAARHPRAGLLRHALLPAGRRRRLRQRQRPGDQRAAAALDPRALGPDLRGRELDQHAGAAGAADARPGRRQLPGHEDRHHRVQLGRARPHQRRAGPGRRPRHLRPRRARPGHPVGAAGGHRAGRVRVPDVPQLRRRGRPVRRRRRPGDQRRPGPALGVRGRAVVRRRADDDGGQQERRGADRAGVAGRQVRHGPRSTDTARRTRRRSSAGPTSR